MICEGCVAWVVRHEVSQVSRNGSEEENGLDAEEIDVPPFLKKYIVRDKEAQEILYDYSLKADFLRFPMLLFG